MSKATQNKTHQLYLVRKTDRGFLTFAFKNLNANKEEAWGYVGLYGQRFDGEIGQSIVVKDETGCKRLPGKYLYLGSTGPHDDKDLARRMREAIENYLKQNDDARIDRVKDGEFFGHPKWFPNCGTKNSPEYWRAMNHEGIISEEEFGKNVHWLYQLAAEVFVSEMQHPTKAGPPPEKEVPWETYP
ncbi:hypothetical protein VFPPC_02191 [Pochonia chlamydosporia 170]|uniref:Uncharacterized protein n=1 Tax=Pochonia chlamydosporia 170 TaxID=1380566 RepID=A0A179F6U2_METCM|nr:hypothetical protein VFPPC_02191 [Pochonia chlamydosporia 170]OAQ61186.1 hypothetical protein VFPPC_02191 [Pochonia chlamydosporia 170]